MPVSRLTRRAGSIQPSGDVARPEPARLEEPPVAARDGFAPVTLVMGEEELLRSRGVAVEVLPGPSTAITALVAVLSLAIQRTGLVWRWLGSVGLVAAAIFLLGSIFSVLGRTPEKSSSLLGVGLFIGWMLVLSAGLWRTAASSTSSPS